MKNIRNTSYSWQHPSGHLHNIVEPKPRIKNESYVCIYIFNKYKYRFRV